MEYREGNLDRARELFQQGVWADPTSASVAKVFHAWGVLEKHAGNVNLARELFRCAVKADPNSEPSWLVCFRLYHAVSLCIRLSEHKHAVSEGSTP